MQYILLLVFAAALWIRGMLFPCDPVQAGPESPLYQLLNVILPPYGFISSILGMLLLLMQAWYLNYILIKHDIVPKNSLVTALVYILLMSQSIAYLNLNPVLCSLTFILPALDRILNTYGKADPTRELFGAAFLISLASLFYFPMLFLLLLVILSLIVFGTFNIRLILVVISGMLAVYLYVFLYYFLIDELNARLCLYLHWFRDFPPISIRINAFEYVLWGLQGLLFLTAFFYVLSRINEWNISIRKIMLLSFYMLFVTFASMAYLLDEIRLAWLITALPFSIFISSYLSNIKRLPWWLEFYFFAWIILTFINNLFLAVC